MGLFTRLLNLNTNNIPLEDFFTELVAYLLSTSDEILHSWIDQFTCLDTNSFTEAHVSSQVEFQPLDSHTSGSRPDIVIQLSDGKDYDIIFIESKIGSLEGDGQLMRYAEILANEYQDAQSRTLLYITHYYDPKDKTQIFKNLENPDVTFIQSRWHEFYLFLKSLSENNTLADEIIIFMEENGMSQSQQFSPLDVLTITNMVDVLNILDETMSDEVREKFRDVVGSVKFSFDKTWARYIIGGWFNDDWWCFLGYRFQNKGSEYPSLGITLQINPKGNPENLVEIKKIFLELSKNDAWVSYNMNTPKAWVALHQHRSLQEFLPMENHVLEIKSYFIDLLNGIDELKLKYPQLPWSTSSS